MGSGPAARAAAARARRHGSPECKSSVTTGASPGPRPADSERPLGPCPRGKEDNKSLENNAGSGSESRARLAGPGDAPVVTSSESFAKLPLASCSSFRVTGRSLSHGRGPKLSFHHHHDTQANLNVTRDLPVKLEAHAPGPTAARAGYGRLRVGAAHEKQSGKPECGRKTRDRRDTGCYSVV